nr:integrase, catalytic region, zinc finger, CCHC-type, peptidase aspartic, catalytic [Tanacetum cinerariifolium]
ALKDDPNMSKEQKETRGMFKNLVDEVFPPVEETTVLSPQETPNESPSEVEALLDASVEYKHAVMNLTCLWIPAAFVGKTCRSLISSLQRASSAFRSKDEAAEEIKNFVKNNQVTLNATVRFVRTDNGTEFVKKTLTDFFKSVGITHQTSVPRTPQQNGVVERRNRTLMEAARTMLIFAKALLFLWAKAIATMCYTLNRSLVHTLHGKTYYELLKGKKPNVSYFNVFGSLCYPTNDYDDVGKLKVKADIGIFVGYTPTKKAYRIYNKRT